MSWTEYREAQLRDMWPDKRLSCRMIAEIMGITRNAIIGKAKRLGLGPKPSINLHIPKARNSARVKRRPRRMTFAANPEPFVPATIEAVPSFGRSILDIAKNECRYATHEDEETSAYRFCGHSVSPGKPYCEVHCRVAYRPINERMQKATTACFVFV